jgi:hypothetical protein
MGVGVEARSQGPPRARFSDQPAHAEYNEQPERDAQHEGTREEAPSGHWVRVAKWPLISAFAVVQVAWVVTLVYLIHYLVATFILGPLFG